MRLDKCIASQGKYSRSDVKRLIKQKLIVVDGQTAVDSGMKVNPESSKIIVDSEELFYKEHIYIMLN